MKDKALPEGWNKINITKVFTQISTTGKNIATKDCLSVGKYPVIDQGAEYISGYFNDETKVIPVENKVIVFGDHTRNFKLIDFDFIVGADGVKIFQPAKDIDPDFFYYQCLSLNLPNKGYHRHFRYLKECDFIYPSFSQQQKLAKKFTALLSQVAEIKQRLEKIPVLLKTYRQSVLARAVNGELTNNGILFSKCKLKDIFTFIDGDRSSNYPKKEEYLSEGHCLFLSTKNVRPYGFDFSEQIYISKEKDEILRKGKLERGDLIITTRGTLGNVAIYDDTVKFEHIRINSGMLILRLQNQKFQNEYFKILIASPVFQSLILEKQTGSAQPQLPAGILKEFEVPIPNIEQQKQITQAVEKHLNFANQLEAQVNAALERINLMTQAILAKGFRGELL
ncbi:restriction endonuclease subunit S [Glaesserella parasuis]|uniref:restriction endonuclease subunit S n=1 Tax=Glaesserella parasuis TaxID=738 RepID=UPI00243730A6|nr:restriction endonuclease subunit S [Glaesserella parasuis]MDG6471157.1 restriction endonuclease subunit S [Glaesserella parasuis]MDG6792762.1 restriction endonuclease subunit S [Glaesserella parasuis]MDG6853556.1 restriction endonuclease subunit S [Glaesserella parasuis]MDO9671602.1 restriction endonuclease subunit S [Glaesserella parasuis]MDO9689790.1 restriction endonuclease subunit S [Glaesserella parasuis]